MGRYRVRLLGRNFLLSIGGKTGRYGFYTTRWVEANDPASAELKAVQLVEGEESLKSAVLNHPDDPPLLFMEGLSPDHDRGEEPAYTFSPEREDSEPALDLDSELGVAHPA